MIYYLKIPDHELINIAETSFKSVYFEPYTQKVLLKCIDELENDSNSKDIYIIDQKGKRFNIDQFLKMVDKMERKHIPN